MRRLSIRRIKILEKVRQIIRIQLEFELKFMWQQLFSSVQFSRSVVSDSLRPHESQHARPPCPSPTPGVHSDSRLSSQWCHSAISSSVVPFSSCPQSLPASKSFPMSQLFAWGGQSTGVSALASFPPEKSQGWSPSEWTALRTHNYLMGPNVCRRQKKWRTEEINCWDGFFLLSLWTLTSYESIL